MIKTIVVPIDIAEKEAGAAALGLARDLAKTHGGEARTSEHRRASAGVCCGAVTHRLS